MADASDQSKPRARARHQHDQYSTYIYKVLKQVHPDVSITRSAMATMDSFVRDTFERIMVEAGHLARYSKRQTITSREIQTAVRLILPGELARHAITHGSAAVVKYRTPSDAS